jgi:hypothetical protein
MLFDYCVAPGGFASHCTAYARPHLCTTSPLRHLYLLLLLQVLSERPLAFWQIVIAIGAIELSVGKQDYENKVG